MSNPIMLILELASIWLIYPTSCALLIHPYLSEYYGFTIVKRSVRSKEYTLLIHYFFIVVFMLLILRLLSVSSLYHLPSLSLLPSPSSPAKRLES